MMIASIGLQDAAALLVRYEIDHDERAVVRAPLRVEVEDADPTIRNRLLVETTPHLSAE